MVFGKWFWEFLEAPKEVVSVLEGICSTIGWRSLWWAKDLIHISIGFANFFIHPPKQKLFW